MLTIWKYPLSSGLSLINIPQGGVVLTVQTQNEAPFLWVLVDPIMPAQSRMFSIYGTGHPIPVGQRTYIGTFQQQGGALVFHVFEEK